MLARLFAAATALTLASPLGAQTSGSILGRVVDAETGAAIEAATIEVVGTGTRALSGTDGRFVIVAVPPGERSLRIEHLGYRTQVVEGIVIRTGRSIEVLVELTTAPVVIAGVTVEAQRVRLVEPDVSSTHDILLARELGSLPVDRLEQILELSPGVSGGHFRGGRFGQEVHVVDGMELKNQFEASSRMSGIELSPTSLEEVEIITGGFGAQYGSALSGVVSYITRRGNSERWTGRIGTMTDEWAPDAESTGFTAISASAGGPLRFLGGGTTLFVDVLAQGMLDAEPHSRGLTCLREADVEETLAAEIRRLREVAPSLVCPWTNGILPHQRGDKFIGFARIDRQLAQNLHVYATFVRNRNQQELFMPEFMFNGDRQLGLRSYGTLGTLNIGWSRNTPERAWFIAGRVGLMRLDRYIGVVAPGTFDGTRIGRFGFDNYRFLGEDFVRSSIDAQLSAPRPIPGYEAPGGAVGSPFGHAGTGIFFTDGTPHIAAWATTDVFNADAVAEILSATGSSLRTGISTKLYSVKSYERTFGHLTGSLPNYAQFYPASGSVFADGRVAVSDEMTINVGLRLDAFRSGINFHASHVDFLSPVIETKWNLSVSPRFGVAMPIPGTDNKTVMRFNYGYVSQPPDFQYFLDTSVSDSMRADIRRQGNPLLSFERGKSYELGLSSLLHPNLAAALAIFRKELSYLATGTMRVGTSGDQQYSTDDEGTVQGVELSVRAKWSSFAVRTSWAIQSATGVAAGTDSDSLANVDHQFIEYPLAFDRRHSIDVALFYGAPAGITSPWSAALVASIQSGYPVDRIEAADNLEGLVPKRLPWTSTIDLRVGRELGRLPGCAECRWRITADARNALDRENIVAVRRETGRLGPSWTAFEQLRNAMPNPGEVYVEEPHYNAGIDLDGDGVIRADEFANARSAAALSRFDPSLFFGQPRQVRLGIEVTFR